MDEQNPSAQGSHVETPVVGEGIQARINELVAKQRQAEEALRERDQQLMAQTAQMAQMAMQATQRVAPVAAPVDPLAQYKDQMDPVALQAIQAAVQETQRRMEAQYAPQFAHQAAQLAAMTAQAEAAAIPGLPKEVSARAAQLAAEWRRAGINYPTSDAINFALGEYQRGQLIKAAPVTGYNPAAQTPYTVTPGFTPAYTPPRQNALPANFDQLNPAQQNAALDASGALDEPF